MASSSGVSSESSKLQNSGSDEDLNQVMDQRKRKRMLSNRESARRSRMRKQEHMTDLTAQIGLLTRDNNQIITSMNVTNQLYMKLEAENSVLRAQMDELRNRLQSLNDIMDCINSSKWIYEEEDNHNNIGGDFEGRVTEGRAREREATAMLVGVKLQLAWNPRINQNANHSFAVNINPRRLPHHLRLPPRRLSSVSVQSQYVKEASGRPVSSLYTETVGSPSLSQTSLLQPPQWNLTHRHLVVLNVVACAVAVSATCLFFSAIPTLLAFKRAAQSLEKLMDVMREELPDTMAAVRLSGMEISDLTMELSDIGHEITQGVRSSTRAVRVAEERLRGLTNMASSGSKSEN